MASLKLELAALRSEQDMREDELLAQASPQGLDWGPRWWQGVVHTVWVLEGCRVWSAGWHVLFRHSLAAGNVLLTSLSAASRAHTLRPALLHCSRLLQIAMLQATLAKKKRRKGPGRMFKKVGRAGLGSGRGPTQAPLRWLALGRARLCHRAALAMHPAC